MKAKVIAFYLPQFHPTVENDKWWGKGFTEWTNVTKAKPMFRGHYQPHLPADLGFYDLRVKETREAQAELAKQYGVHGFCYYHYWFGGRQILERPFNDVLNLKEPDLPFCLCWANHNWNNIWQGCSDRILIEQTYPGMDDHQTHFNYLLKAFTDPRYITVDGKPLFLVYNPDEIPEVNRVTDYWRELALQADLKGLYLIAVSYQGLGWNPHKHGFDASTWQPLPQRNGRIPWHYPGLKLRHLLDKEKFQLTIYDYAEIMENLLRKKKPTFTDYPTVLPNWDNTPRSGLNGLVLQNSSPELFRIVLNQALSQVADQMPEYRLIFIKAWNEWAEGNYLEPDLQFGHGYLKVIRDAILNTVAPS